VRAYAKVVAEKSTLRQLLKASEQISADVFNLDPDEMDVSTIVAKSEKRIIDVGSRQLRDAKPVDTMEVLVQDYRRRLVERTNNPSLAFGIDTGFADLNHLTGGWQDTDLIIIAARPSMGKTGCMLQTVLSCAKRRVEPVVVFSLEMSKEQLMNRLVAIEAMVDGNSIRKSTVADDDWLKIDHATEVLSELPILIFDTPAMTTFEMRAHLRRVEKDYGKPAMIAVDYLQLAHHHGKVENRTQEISEIARTFKSMARENVCPLIALSQLSRAVEQREDKRPILSDLRESGSIEAEADVVAMMYREGYYKKLKAASVAGQNDNDVTEVIIGKQRNGPTGTVKLLWRPEYTRLENMAPDWAQQH
jgi:replicative DNA helicase